MTTYRNIHGRSIKAVATDPTAEVSEGEIWYNTGSDTFKSILSSEAWASGGASTTARRFLAGCGPQTAGLIFGGFTTTTSNATEEYNGSGFSNGGNLNTARNSGSGFGTQTAGVYAGGYTTTAVASTEEYGGTSWTAGNNMGTARYGVAGLGILTAGLAVGGKEPSVSGKTEEYDGTNWTESGDLNTVRESAFSAGTQTAALAVGGGPVPSAGNKTEHYDGTSWTTQSATLNTARAQGINGAVGTQTAALVVGGDPQRAATEKYDGTTWSEIADLATGRSGLTGGGSSTAAWGAAGYTTANVSLTEEFTKSATVFTPSAWAAGGNMPAGKRVGGSSTGGSVSGLTFGGDNVPMGQGIPQVKTTEEYNGTAWTGGGNITNNVSGSAGAGTQTAMIGATGYSFPTPWTTAGASYIANAFEYDGSSWTNVTAYPTTGVGMMSLGTQTASLFGGGAQGGSPGPEANQKSKDYKEYNGSSWTTGGASNTFHSRSGGAGGTQTAGIIYGGYDGPGGNPSGRSDKVEEYNGTAWTSAITAPKESAIGSGFGTQTAFLYSGGQESPIPNSPGTTGFSFTTLVYDGTTMRTDANTATRRVYSGADGAIGTAAGFVAGGATSYSARTTATEEYSQGSSAINVKTLTQS